MLQLVSNNKILIVACLYFKTLDLDFKAVISKTLIKVSISTTFAQSWLVLFLDSKVMNTQASQYLNMQHKMLKHDTYNKMLTHKTPVLVEWKGIYLPRVMHSVRNTYSTIVAWISMGIIFPLVNPRLAKCLF